MDAATCENVILTLAVEHSTSEGSAALLRDGAVCGAESWHDAAPGQRQLFSVVENLLRKTGHRLSDIALFAVGLGPGAYTNMRTSLSAVQGFAAPGGTPVRGICSAEALARDIALARNAKLITISGNARRGRLWMMQFDFNGRDVETRTGMTLIEPDNLPAKLAADEVVATPDWSTIGRSLQSLGLPPGALIDHACIPRAETVGMLALRMRNPLRTEPPGPLSPVYIYPPVF